MYHEKLKCYQIALEVLKEVNVMTKVMPRGLGNVNDQIKRAMTSSVLNLVEGNAKYAKAERRRFFQISLGSLAESAACIDIYYSLNLISSEKQNHIKSRLKAVYSMIYKLQ